MRIVPLVRRSLALTLAATVLASVPASLGTAAPPPAPSQARLRTPDRVLPGAVVHAGLRARGTTIRRDAGVRVERLALGPAIRAKLRDRNAAVYRVTVAGRFPPRALRYVVRAGQRPVAFGIPRRDEGAVIAITDDPAVTTAPVTARYEGRGRPVRERFRPAPARNAPLPTPGPFDVTVTSYDFGDRVYQPAGLGGRVELRAAVYHPADLSAGPYPIVLFLHGNHSTCYKGRRAGYEWPCRPGWQPIPNHEGYAYLGSRLASYGYVVASVSGNGVNVLGNDIEDTGMRQRGLLLERHLALWDDWNTIGGDPFGTTFVGTVDMDRIGVMGHSRGGEGAVYQALVDRQRPVPFGIDAVLPLAPVDFTRVTLNDVPLGVILPYCDGDVSDLQGVHFFDDSRYEVPGDPTPKGIVTAFGANHNFFNTVWSPSSGYPGAFDDNSTCRDTMREPEQRRFGAHYMTAFLREHVGGEADPRSLWTGGTPPASIDPASRAVTYLAPDDPAWRFDVDRFDRPRSLGRTEPGGDVLPADLGIVSWCADTEFSPCVPGDWSWLDVHLSASWLDPPQSHGLQQAVLGWDTDRIGVGSVRFEIPATDVTAMDHLSFRAVTNPGYWWNESYGFQDLSVVIEDGGGDRATVAAADVGNDALAFPIVNRGRRTEGHVMLQQLRFPLAGFAGVDLDDVVAVELVFDRTEVGVVNVADLAFQREG